MDRIECAIQITWQHRVLFTDQLFRPTNRVLRDVLTEGQQAEPRKALVVLDQSLAQAQPEVIATISAYFSAHADALKLVCPPQLLPGGENIKNSTAAVSELHAQIDRYHIDRHSYLIAIGGGALLDMAGFAAATAHRGIRHVRIPTTTLSQCDSGIGLKNGINAFSKKNFIGTFAPPYAVLNDFDWLATLPPRSKRAGYAEAVKVACIRDRAFFENLEHDAARLAAFDPAAMRRLIFRCAQLHLDHIATGGDPFETGARRPLDFGHWTAHKLEQLSGFKLPHGEAVAIGMALDVIYSRRQGYLEPASAERILCLLEQLGFQLFTPDLLHTGQDHRLSLLQGLEEFREHLGGQLTITLLREIGSAFEVHEMGQSQIVASIHELQARHPPDNHQDSVPVTAP